MRKVSIRLAVSILAISILVLAGSTALGVNQINNTGNITANGTATGTVNATNTVNETPVMTTVQTPVTTIQTPEETTVQTPEETVPVPIPTKSPGFESIFAIATILSAVYIFGIRRR